MTEVQARVVLFDKLAPPTSHKRSVGGLVFDSSVAECIPHGARDTSLDEVLSEISEHRAINEWSVHDVLRLETPPLRRGSLLPTAAP